MVDAMKSLGDGLDRLSAALRQSGEAAGRLVQVMDKSINESLAKLTPEQRERYHLLVAAGAYKLEALAAVRNNRWPKGTPRKGKKGKQ